MSPKSVALALARPLHPGICTVMVHLGSAKMFLVCMAKEERENSGHPVSSMAKSTMEPNGYPALRWCIWDMMVHSVAYLACSSRFLTALASVGKSLAAVTLEMPADSGARSSPDVRKAVRMPVVPTASFFDPRGTFVSISCDVHSDGSSLDPSVASSVSLFRFFVPTSQRRILRCLKDLSVDRLARTTFVCSPILPRICTTAGPWHRIPLASAVAIRRLVSACVCVCLAVVVVVWVVGGVSQPPKLSDGRCGMESKAVDGTSQGRSKGGGGIDGDQKAPLLPSHR